jgi:hypothetical protein
MQRVFYIDSQNAIVMTGSGAQLSQAERIMQERDKP